MEFSEYCKRAADAGDAAMARTLERLPAEADWSYGAAKNHLQAQRAPAWCKSALTMAHANYIAEREPAPLVEDIEAEPVEDVNEAVVYSEIELDADHLRAMKYDAEENTAE